MSSIFIVKLSLRLFCDAICILFNTNNDSTNPKEAWYQIYNSSYQNNVLGVQSLVTQTIEKNYVEMQDVVETD